MFKWLLALSYHTKAFQIKVFFNRFSCCSLCLAAVTSAPEARYAICVADCFVHGLLGASMVLVGERLNVAQTHPTVKL